MTSRTKDRSVQVHRRFSMRVATIWAVIIVGVALVIVLVDQRSWFLAPLILAVGWLFWVTVVWPSVTLRRDEAIVQNLLFRWAIPYGQIESVRSGLALRIRLRDGRTVTALGVPGQTGMGWDAIRTADAHASSIVPVRRVDDLRPVAGQTMATGVAQTLVRRSEQASHADAEPVVRSVNASIIALTVLVILAAALALALRPV